MAKNEVEIDYYKAVEDKKTELSALHARMDNDRALVELGEYTLKDVNGHAVPNAISVTLNDPGVFAVNVESSLGSATEQVIVETEDKQLDTAYIEDFVKACFASANSRLIKVSKPALNPFFDQQMCRRGRGAARCLFRMDTKTNTLITDIMEWDTRFYYSGKDADGQSWAGYEIYKTKDAIAAEAWAKKEKFAIEDEDALVLEVWSKQKHLIWVNDRKAFEEPHPFGRVPVVEQVVPMGSMMADKDSRAAEGESIFFLIRDLVPELNRLVSIIQSLNMKALDNALLYKTPDGKEGEPPEDLTKPGAVHPMSVDSSVEPVNFGELKRSAYLLHTMIETRVQRGSVTNLDLGIMGNQPWSAVALLEIGEGREVVFLPRLGARGMLNQQLAEMIIEQVIATGATSVEVGARGHKRTFDTRKLMGEYDISFKYFIKSPKIDVARTAMAEQQRGLIPNKAIRRDTLQREDPEEDERQLRWEEAEQLSPAIKMNRTIQSLLEMAKRGDKHAELEAQVLSAEMGVNLKAMLAGEVQQQPTPDTEKKTSPMLPMFDTGGVKAPSQGVAGPPVEPRGE